MTNLEPIVRKLIKALLYKYVDRAHIQNWIIFIDGKSFQKEALPDESIDQVIDWFYFNVLQSEHEEKEACQEKI